MWNKFKRWLWTYKCTCGTKLYDCNTTEDNFYYLDDCSGLVTEYDIVCKNCGEIIGHWAYGYYEPPIDRYEELFMRLYGIKYKFSKIFRKHKRNSFFDTCNYKRSGIHSKYGNK